MCRELLRITRTPNLYKAAAFCQVFDNAPKQVSKHHIGLGSYSYSFLNARNQCCQGFRWQLEGTWDKGAHLSQNGCRWYTIRGKKSGVTVMAAEKLSCFLYYVSCKVVQGSINCSGLAITVLVWVLFWQLL